jgi:divalent metal cation (Fe/Co/Zn/Cd) transporter
MRDGDRSDSKSQAEHIISSAPAVAICACLGGLLLFGNWLLQTETAMIVSFALLGAMVHLCCVSLRE